MKPTLTRPDYERLSRPRYGVANPERIENPLWEAAFRENLGGHALRKRFGDARNPFENHSAASAYRECANGPVWCWLRMGGTRTELADGRVVHIGGEHEDWYDPDFCIYNEVIVEHPDGPLEIFGYPKDVFPPTDFHSATLVGDAILVIGSLGYRDLRRPGETQLFRLDLASFRMERLEADGPPPGWIFRHETERLEDGSILILGGEIERAKPMAATPEAVESVDNERLHAFDPTRLRWREIAHGDTRLFPVSMDAYRRGRSPRYGAVNPERLCDPFKIEAARRAWRPLRARRQFGDPRARRPDKEGREVVHGQRPIEEVVWTSERTGAAEITLADGRRLTIAGAFSDFGDEWGDRWIYNDVILREPEDEGQSGIAVYAYPESAFPPLISCCALLVDGRLLVFGQASRFCAYDRQSIALEIDLATMAATLLDAAPNTRAFFSDGAPPTVEAERVIFSGRRMRHEDPPAVVAFDLKTSRWSEA